MNKLLISLLAFGAFSNVYAADLHQGKLESCLKAALAKHPGDVVSLEAEIEDGKPTYEFDIKGKDGKEWEVECDAKTAKLIEEEEEVKTIQEALESSIVTGKQIGRAHV